MNVKAQTLPSIADKFVEIENLKPVSPGYSAYGTARMV
jgi:hypothetical protein